MFSAHDLVLDNAYSMHVYYPRDYDEISDSKSTREVRKKVTNVALDGWQLLKNDCPANQLLFIFVDSLQQIPYIIPSKRSQSAITLLGIFYCIETIVFQRFRRC